MVKSRESAAYRPHHYYLYELTPDYVSPDGLTRHNSYGFRGPEFPIVKSHGGLRVVTIGESTTYCLGIREDQKTYPARLEAHLRKTAPGHQIEVLNAGVGGYTSAEILLQYIFKIQPLRPDILVHYFTHNDVHPRRFPTLSRDYAEYSRSWYEPPPSMGARIRWAMRLIRSPESTGHSPKIDVWNVIRRYGEYKGRRQAINVLANPVNIFHDNLKNLMILAKAWGSTVFMVTPPYRGIDPKADRSTTENPVWQAVFEHAQVARTLAAEFEFPCYDLSRDLPYDEEKPNEYFVDRVHVNERGADLMGQLVASAISRWLVKTQGNEKADA